MVVCFLFVALTMLSLVTVPICVEILSATFIRAGSASRSRCALRYPIVVLMPAHDEAKSIEGVVRASLVQLTENDRLIVIADNCSDDTAALVRRIGVEVIERNDLSRVGKGYALAFGVDYIRTADQRTIVVFIDADCYPEKHALSTIARTAAKLQCPVQGSYLMRWRAADAVSLRVLCFLWLLKNHIRPLGLRKLNLPCQIHGSGFAVPLSLLSKIDLRSGHLTEDVRLGLDLALAGHPTYFVPSAKFLSEFAPSDAGMKAQRTRWHQGHMSLIGKYILPLLVESFTSVSLKPLALAFDLIVPPLSLLLLAFLGLLLCCTTAVLFFNQYNPLILVTYSFILFLTCLAIAWLKFGKSILPVSDLPFILITIANKTVSTAVLSFSRKVGWRRSERAER